MNPKHRNPHFKRFDSGQDKWVQAQAPYNFVPLPEEVIAVDPYALPNHDRYQYHTGQIKCSLTTLTPLYTRGAIAPSTFRQVGSKIREIMKDPELRDKYAQFFHIDNVMEPVIPGSSLRGMIRSLVELFGSGKMQWVTDRRKFSYRAVAAPSDDALKKPYEAVLGRFGSLVRVGYLQKHKDTWQIIPAKLPVDMGFSEKRTYLQVKDANLDTIPGLIRYDEPGFIPQYHNVSLRRETRRGTDGNDTFIRVGPAKSGYQYSGILICSGNMRETDEDNSGSPRKKYAVVLEPDSTLEPFKIDTQAVQDYQDSLSEFQKSKPFDEETGCLKEGRPVFFVPNGIDPVLYFGHTPNFRVQARNLEQGRALTPIDFVPERLRREEIVDLAEAIFGYVKGRRIPQGKERSYAGRVYFTDAQFSNADNRVFLTAKPIAPNILASPKPDSFQHYLTQQEPDTVKRHEAGDELSETRLQHYGSSPSLATIRGSKLYWHRNAPPAINDIIDQDFRDKEQAEQNDGIDIWQDDTQHTLIRPVSTGVTFEFCIHFENLRDHELGALLWALVLPAPEGDSTEYRHKLGMAKPLGMGSVRINVDNLLLDNRQPSETNDVVKSRYEQLLNRKNTWHCPVDNDFDVEDFLRAFDAYLKPKDSANESEDSYALYGNPRIQTLLKLLQWPGPDSSRTRYMVPDDHKTRPVLSEPLQVEREFSEEYRPHNQRRDSHISQSGSEGLPPNHGKFVPKKVFNELTSTGQTIVDNMAKRLAVQEEQVEPVEPESDSLSSIRQPRSVQDIETGDYLEGEIKSVSFTGDRVVDIGLPNVKVTLPGREIDAARKAQASRDEDYVEGQTIRAWVKYVVPKRGEVRLTIQPPK